MKLCTTLGYCLIFWVETLVVMSEFDGACVRGLKKKKRCSCYAGTTLEGTLPIYKLPTLTREQM